MTAPGPESLFGPPVVVFACVHNAGRSQMAAALFTRAADPAKVRAISAGTRPATAVHPEVVLAMQELRIDLSKARPQKFTEALAKGATLVVTLGCGEECPVVPGQERVDWAIPDPRNRPVAEVRRIRDQIAGWVTSLVAERGWGLPELATDPRRPPRA